MEQPIYGKLKCENKSNCQEIEIDQMFHIFCISHILTAKIVRHNKQWQKNNC